MSLSYPFLVPQPAPSSLGPLTVTNPGFEADGGVTSLAAITGWAAAAKTYGVDAATATEVVRSARLNNPGSLSQLTAETSTAGYTDHPVYNEPFEYGFLFKECTGGWMKISSLPRRV